MTKNRAVLGLKKPIHKTICMRDRYGRLIRINIEVCSNTTGGVPASECFAPLRERK